MSSFSRGSSDALAISRVPSQDWTQGLMNTQKSELEQLITAKANEVNRRVDKIQTEVSVTLTQIV